MIDSEPRKASPPLRIEQSAPARPSDVDRLARLVRLIEQDETLAAIVRRGQPDQPVELSRPEEKPPCSDLAREDKTFEHYWEGEAQAGLLHPGSCDTPAGEPLDPPEYGEYDSPDYSNGLPDQRLGLRVFAVLIGLALGSSASAFAYWALSDGRGRSAEARVMPASISPDKTAPSLPEHTRPDEPLPAQSDERRSNATGPTTTGAEEPADAKPPMPQAPMDIVLGPAPIKVAGLIPEPTPPGSPASAPQNQPPDVKKPAPRKTAAGATEPSGADAVRYVVQLSAERGEAAAHVRSRELQTKYPNAFAGRKPFIRRADLGDRGVYYRVQMGPFAIGEANEICGDLKKSGADCVVQRN
jgi:SPOR domain